MPTSVTDWKFASGVERMINVDNIPLRMGLNPKFAVTLRFQRLNSALDPIHKLVVLYQEETKKGKPYAKELASMMVYEAKVSAALLEVGDPYLASPHRGCSPSATTGSQSAASPLLSHSSHASS